MKDIELEKMNNSEKYTQTVYDVHHKMNYIISIVQDTFGQKVQLNATDYQLFQISQMMNLAGLDEADVKAIVELAVFQGPVRNVQTATHFRLKFLENEGFVSVPCLCSSPVSCGGEVNTFENISSDLISYPKLQCYEIENEMKKWLKKQNDTVQFNVESEKEPSCKPQRQFTFYATEINSNISISYRNDVFH